MLADVNNDIKHIFGITHTHTLLWKHSNMKMPHIHIEGKIDYKSRALKFFLGYFYIPYSAYSLNLVVNNAAKNSFDTPEFLFFI